MEQEFRARFELFAIVERCFASVHHSSFASWIMKADRMNKDIFVAFKQRPSEPSITALLDDIGTLHIDLDSVLSISTSFCSSLFSANLLTDDISVARDLVWSHITPSFTHAMIQEMLAPFRERESCRSRLLDFMPLLA